MNTHPHGRALAFALLALAAASALLPACARQNAEVKLVPEKREGQFYMQFADAREAAQKENKMILVDFWRPG